MGIMRRAELLQAWRRARRGKRGRPSVASFELNAAEHLLAHQRQMREKRYRPRLTSKGKTYRSPARAGPFDAAGTARSGV